jgi:hypothetical protein
MVEGSIRRRYLLSRRWDDVIKRVKMDLIMFPRQRGQLKFVNIVYCCEQIAI